MSGEIKTEFYPQGITVLTFDGGYSLHPTPKAAADFLRTVADDVEAHGKASQSRLGKWLTEVMDSAGIKPVTDKRSSDNGS